MPANPAIPPPSGTGCGVPVATGVGAGAGRAVADMRRLRGRLVVEGQGNLLTGPRAAGRGRVGDVVAYVPPGTRYGSGARVRVASEDRGSPRPSRLCGPRPAARGPTILVPCDSSASSH